MSKLHELLSVEGDLEGIFKKILKETKDTFSKRTGHFFGYNKRLEMFDENAPEAPEENQELTTTVSDKLNYTMEHVNRYFDALVQKEATNQGAVANLVVDGTTIATGLPATFLLGMESRLKMIREVFSTIPTLPPGKKWEKDESRGNNVFIQSVPDEKFKTAKTFKHKTLYEATEHHPAQIERWEETENVGKYITTTWSGMMTTAEKSAMIGRLDKLIRATKKARQKANCAEVQKITVAKEISNYILGK